MKNQKYTKVTLILSVCLLLVWGLLGAGATIAWFTDTTPTAVNTFDIGMLDLQVSYKKDGMDKFKPVDESVRVFNDEALYEPGYTQVIYLEIKNAGEVDFNYKLSVDVRGYRNSTNMFGMTLHLPDFLRFGVVFGDSVPALDRELAQSYADQTFRSQELNQYAQEDIEIAKGGVRYAAIVLYMPEEVGNAANHMAGANPPEVYLGITVYAQQAGTPMS